MPLTKIDREALRLLRPLLAKELEAFGKKHGLTFAIEKGEFSNGPTGSFKLSTTHASSAETIAPMPLPVTRHASASSSARIRSSTWRWFGLLP